MGQLIISSTGTITSKELVDQINIFRADIEGKSELAHSDLLKIIRDEFEEEIDQGNISSVFFKDSYGREQPMFNLTIAQAKQVLVRESKIVRKAVIKRLEELETAKPKELTFEEMQIRVMVELQYRIDEQRKEAAKLVIERDEKAKSARKNIGGKGGMTRSRNMVIRELAAVCHNRGIPTPDEWEFFQREDKRKDRLIKKQQVIINSMED